LFDVKLWECDIISSSSISLIDYDKNMPLPCAHALVGATVTATLLPSVQPRPWKALLIGAFLGICPDFDFVLNLFRISGGGWRHGFTHSVVFALSLGLIAFLLSRESKARSFILPTAAVLSHTLLDFLITRSYGVELWWPFTKQRFKLSLANPIDYSWSSGSLWKASFDVLKISLFELMIFGPILLLVVMARRFLEQRSVVSNS
jgi:membrane-bound metal-dependent hydrolase YbcI (DUF457 family)